MNDFSGVSCERSEECSVSVHDDEAEFRVGFHQFGEGFCVEFVVAEIQRPHHFTNKSAAVLCTSLGTSKRERAGTDVLIGRCGSKSMFNFFSFPSSVRTVPQ